METEVIGWLSAGLLLFTISTQVWKQWQSGSSVGVSSWLFIGQISASVGFVIYSYLLDNLVFVLTNSLLLVAAIIGQGLYLRNRRRDKNKSANKQEEGKRQTSRKPMREGASAAR